MVNSEATAIERAESHAGGWQLAIVDLTLDQGDGFSIVRYLKQGAQCGAVVVFSAFVPEVIQRHCIALGADAVFNKTEKPPVGGLHSGAGWKHVAELIQFDPFSTEA